MGKFPKHLRAVSSTRDKNAGESFLSLLTILTRNKHTKSMQNKLCGDALFGKR